MYSSLAGPMGSVQRFRPCIPSQRRVLYVTACDVWSLHHPAVSTPELSTDSELKPTLTWLTDLPYFAHCAERDG